MHRSGRRRAMQFLQGKRRLMGQMVNERIITCLIVGLTRIVVYAYTGRDRY